ncbi:putative multi-domain containing protein, partial [Aduncisulcus paluster]
VHQWVEEERIWPLDEFIWKVMLDSGFYNYIGAMPGGMGRQANLRLLIDKAGQFERLGSGGLFEFIGFFEKLKSSSGDMGTASTIGESEDVLRLMSIHKSKGLEFPIVVLAGAGKNFNLRDTYDKVLMHKTYGVGLRYT